MVEHDHNWTVEVEAANVNRPAIIRFHRTGRNRYEYWIYGAGQPEYEHCRWVLDRFRNPHHVRGRNWLVI